MGIKRIFTSKKKRLAIQYDKISLEYNSLLNDALSYHNSSVQAQPLLLWSHRLDAQLACFQRKRALIMEEWAVNYKKMSWWNKLKYDEHYDISDFDGKFELFKKKKVEFDEKYDEDVERLKIKLNEGLKRAEGRLLISRNKSIDLVKESKGINVDEKALLQKAFWVGLFSVPISVANDLGTSDDIFNALRTVHGRFAEMSNSEIWWEALSMPTESLVGLASLTKGAYFEQLVAEDMGGALFEHFNNPVTDITIDGIEFQIKATDSASYIETVEEGVPIIATSEIAELKGLIDGGASNVDLMQSVDLALGGTIVDLPDTTVDILLAGAGGLGFFASVNGINHAAEQYEKDKDILGSLVEGFFVAIVGTLKSIVNLTELIWKIIVSAPIRFVGRMLLSVIKMVIKVVQFFVPSV